ncbi:hypothetical protein CAL29_19540 [Bordetella genomosp. 10]|uniref:Uncharacterized protein n=1 Tax=Bordetella genomosp. 10 TaxID=1416804 RepID=A0A261RZD6_9BORD|nr:hypothetical protein [Bordetella genomosp. 10]OZI30251.1 hypothetical protein CAL29_19540 [Bordetella genomosp. 10]
MVDDLPMDEAGANPGTNPGLPEEYGAIAVRLIDVDQWGILVVLRIRVGARGAAPATMGRGPENPGRRAGPDGGLKI